MKNGHSHTTKRIENGVVVEIEKKAYNTDKEAILKARELNCDPRRIHKLIAYKCDTCHKWHIGRSQTPMTEKERKRYRELMKLEKPFREVKLPFEERGYNIKRIIPSVEVELTVKRNLGLL